MNRLTLSLCLIAGTATAQVSLPVSLKDLAARSASSFEKFSVVQQIYAMYLNGGASPDIDNRCGAALTDLRADTAEAQQLARSVTTSLVTLSGPRSGKKQTLDPVATLLYSQRLALYSALSHLCSNHVDMSPRTAFSLSNVHTDNSTHDAAIINLYLKFP